jgi:hypothetical protein
MMVDVLDLKASFTTIYPEVLEILGIDREEQFNEILQRIEKSYTSIPAA